MADFRINISLDESSSSLENSSFKDRNASRRTFSQSSKVSSAISLIEDSDDESDTATIAESDKENQEDLNDLEEVTYFTCSNNVNIT